METGGYTTENPDKFCKELLETGRPVELRDWLYDGESTLGELQPNHASIEFANRGYAAGAPAIFGVEIDFSPALGHNTSHLVVELPDERGTRQAVLDWAAPVAHEQGFEAYTDVGQRYIYVKLN